MKCHGVLENVKVVATSPISSTKSDREWEDDKDEYPVIVGGSHFGFNSEQLGYLEVCVEEVKERLFCSTSEINSYFEQQIEAISSQLDILKCAMKERQSGDYPGHYLAADGDDRSLWLDQAMSLRNRVAGLLRELDEKEWENSSSDADETEAR
jgi:hypothetical protein